MKRMECIGVILMMVLVVVFFSRCRTDADSAPYSGKKLKSILEKKYACKGKLKLTETKVLEEAPLAKIKYTYSYQEKEIKIHAIASLRYPDSNGFFPFLFDIFGYQRYYEDDYESCIMLQNRKKAQELANKYGIDLMPVDSLSYKPYDKIFLKDSDDVDAAADLILELYNLYNFPTDYDKITAAVRLYRMTGEEVPFAEVKDDRFFLEIRYGNLSKEWAEKHPTIRLDSKQVLTTYLNTNYSNSIKYER